MAKSIAAFPAPPWTRRRSTSSTDRIARFAPAATGASLFFFILVSFLETASVADPLTDRPAHSRIRVAAAPRPDDASSRLPALARPGRLGYQLPLPCRCSSGVE